MASGLRHQLSPWRGRHLDAFHPAVDLPVAAGHSCQLEGHYPSGARIYDRLPRPRDDDGRHVRLARYADVLSVLRGCADPDVHHHRCLGRQAACLCGLQVLPLHTSRLGSDAGLHAGDVYRRRYHRHPDADGPRLCRDDADLAVPWFPCVIRCEGADVACSYMASRRACRGTHCRLDDSRRCAAEDGRIRLYPFLAADVPAGL